MGQIDGCVAGFNVTVEILPERGQTITSSSNDKICSVWSYTTVCSCRLLNVLLKPLLFHFLQLSQHNSL